MKVAKVLEAIRTQKKLTYAEGSALCTKLLKEDKLVTVIIRLSDSVLKAWYEGSRPRGHNQSLEEESTYVTCNQEKAFNPDCGGYSIFATPLASMIRYEQTGMPEYSMDRIEHLKVDWMIVCDESFAD